MEELFDREKILERIEYFKNNKEDFAVFGRGKAAEKEEIDNGDIIVIKKIYRNQQNGELAETEEVIGIVIHSSVLARLNSFAAENVVYLFLDEYTDRISVLSEYIITGVWDNDDDFDDSVSIALSKDISEFLGNKSIVLESRRGITRYITYENSYSVEVTITIYTED